MAYGMLEYDMQVFSVHSRTDE